MVWNEKEVKALENRYRVESTKKIAQDLDKTPKQVSDKASYEGIRKHPKMKLIKFIRDMETPKYKDQNFNDFIMGFVSGEGCFSTSGDKRIFQISLSEKDESLLREIADYLDAGSIYKSEARKENWGAEVHYRVQGRAELWKKIVPFFDNNKFRSSYKGEQYKKWRSKLEEEIPEEVK